MRRTLESVAVFQVTTWLVALALVWVGVLLFRTEPGAVNPGVGLAMWAPFVGRFVATRTVDRSFVSPAPASLRGLSAWSVLLPLAVEALVYGAAWVCALGLGVAEWAPRTSDPWRFARSFGISLLTLPFIGGVLCLGEELGWRGYLQPRLAGVVRAPAVWTGLLWWSFHFPAVLLGGYLASPSPVLTLSLFAIACTADSAVWGWAAARKASLWPAVWFHCFHNYLSQGVFPSLFTADVRWVGEDGVLPTVSHLAAAGIFWLLWVRRLNGRKKAAVPSQ